MKSNLPPTSTFGTDDQAILDAGYQPQLQRSLGFFSSFAVSFSTISVLMGIFSNFSFALTKAGPFGFWTWLIVGGGQILVALVFAELASRIPLTGAIYNWTRRLAGPHIGWLSGWILFIAFGIGSAGVLVSLLPPLQSLISHTFTDSEACYVGIGLILSHTIINIYGVRIAAGLNRAAVIAELIALFVFGGALLAICSIKGELHPALLTTIPASPIPYAPAFMMASLMAAWTIITFELPSDLSEETINASRIAPRSIIYAVLLATMLGFAFLVILALAIPDISQITSESDPISAIMSAHLGSAATHAFQIFVLIAIYASALLAQAAASRILYAIARDKGVIGHRWLTHISAHKVPDFSILLVTFIEAATFLIAKDAVALYGAVTILIFLVYLITIVSFAFGFKNLPAPNGLSLGRWRWPVVILASLWLTAELGVLTIPDDFHDAAIIAGSIVAAGTILSFFVTRQKS